MTEPATRAVTPPEEPDLWSRAAGDFTAWRGGEPAALDRLVRALTPVLWHVVRASGLEEARAEDVVQTTWMTLVRRGDGVSDPRAIGAWLTTTARREAWRVSKVDGRSRPVDDEVLARHVPDATSAETEAVLADDHDRLWRCVGRLSERCVRLLRVVAFDQRPDYAGIAHDLSMPVGSIGPTRRRCLDKLRAELALEGGTA
ncbi:MAG: sigma-70 family RNA polymerase sigma factor [Nocardioidaceae bacterium]|nr:sigma-70 family RNA polymerase sigma factor [Nocardioidaceae bacterium]